MALIYCNRPKRRLLAIDKWGINFIYRGDDLIWLWPWMRGGDRKRKKWIDITAGGYFHSLKDIKTFWVEYEDACRKVYENESKTDF